LLKQWADKSPAIILETVPAIALIHPGSSLNRDKMQKTADKIDFAIAFSEENLKHRTYFYLPFARMVHFKKIETYSLTRITNY